MTRRHFSVLLAGITSAAFLAACGSTGSSSPATNTGTDSTLSVAPPPSKKITPPPDRSTQSGIRSASEATAETVAPQGTITVTIGAAQFLATLADTDTARAFADRLPLTLNMTDVNSNEKAFDLAEALPHDAENPGTIHTGELMLYGSNTIVLFYDSFDTSYTYTRIGRLDASDGLSEAMGAGDVTVTFAHQ